MATRSVATVFGGSGFIGRYVVKRLAAQGHVVRVAVRDPRRRCSSSRWARSDRSCRCMRRSSTRRRCTGRSRAPTWWSIWSASWPSGGAGDFQRIHAEGAGRVARLAAAAGVARLVQMSAHRRRSGEPGAVCVEQGGRRAGGAGGVSRGDDPASVDGVRRRRTSCSTASPPWRSVLPVMPVIAGATRFQPVYVGDVADAVMAGLLRADAPRRARIELGGPRVLTMRELLAYVLAETGRHRPLMTVPMWLARLQAAVLEHLPGKLLTRDQLLMLQRDNVVAPGAPGLAELGIVPTPMDLVVPTYLRRFRPGGGRRADFALA